jgi:hypothetical protein
MTVGTSPQDGAVSTSPGPDPRVATALDEAKALEADGRLLEAIDRLVAANRGVDDHEAERRLVSLRHRAFAGLREAAESTPWPEVVAFEAPLWEGLPMVEMGELTPSVLRSGILTHGCVLVKGLVPRARAEALIDDIERGFAAFEAHTEGEATPETTPWFEPFHPQAEVKGPPLGIQRKRAGRAGSLWTFDSPRLLHRVCELTEDVGLGELIRGYIGQRPVMSATKSNLRRVPLDAFLADWHQDGAFLGKGIRTVNVWITLNDCGEDSPGMDILPARVDDILPTGTEGAIFDWAVSPAVVREAAGETALVRPRFEAGDALLFDECFVHRTACEEGMTKPRYALENWYFAASDYPGAQIPLVY